MDADQSQQLRMEKKEPSDATTRKRVRQPISIPFVWEEFPGTPKQNWKPPPPLPAPKKLEPPPPPKYIASVPFKWEEKPGTPLSSFSQLPPPVSTLATPRLDLVHHGRENVWSSLRHQGREEIDMEDSYPETCESETDDSFTSAAPSLLVPTPVSNAVPAQHIPVIGLDGEQLQSPASPASETETIRSYETGATSLVGAPFLEWLFPLLTPQSKSLDTDGRPEISHSRLQTRKQGNHFIGENNYGASVTKPLTLGELIMMSRRFSYQRKAQMQMEMNLPKKYVKGNGLRSCILETTNVLGGLHKKWMKQLQLKLM